MAKHQWEGRLSWWRFYWLLLLEVLEHPWKWTDSIATLLGIIIPLIIHFRPKMEARMTPLVWEIPVGVFATLGVFRVMSAPFLLYRDHHTFASERHEALRGELSLERDKAEQPDVALVWEWLESERLVNAMANRTEKPILVENRSDKHVYNVQIEPV